MIRRAIDTIDTFKREEQVYRLKGEGLTLIDPPDWGEAKQFQMAAFPADIIQARHERRRIHSNREKYFFSHTRCLTPCLHTSCYLQLDRGENRCPRSLSLQYDVLLPAGTRKKRTRSPTQHREAAAGASVSKISAERQT